MSNNVLSSAFLAISLGIASFMPLSAQAASCVAPLLPPAEGFSFKINEGAHVTSRAVTLTITGGNASAMAVSNSPTFENATLEPFFIAKQWTLSEGDGAKAVYIQLYDGCDAPALIMEAGTAYHAPVQPQVLGEKTNALDPMIAKLKFGQRSAEVQKLQNALIATGFLPAKMKSTTYYGPITRAAVKAYLAKQKTK